MKSFQGISDKTAISLSTLCAIHCLFLPLFIVMLPATYASILNNESFHAWLAFAVIPISIFGLTLGCKKHRRLKLLIPSLTGLSLLIIAALFNDIVFIKQWEKPLTVLASLLIVYGHYKNYKLCREIHCHH